MTGRVFMVSLGLIVCHLQDVREHSGICCKYSDTRQARRAKKNNHRHILNRQIIANNSNRDSVELLHCLMQKIGKDAERLPVSFT